MPDQTTVKITADLSQMKAEFAAGAAEFNRWAQNINAGNATAMRAFRDTAEELRQLGKDARVSSEDMDKLNATIGRVENAAASAGERSANAFERGARGLSVMARQGDVTARSMNQLIASGADIAFAFGPEGAIVSGILMVTAGIVAHFETAETKMEELTRQFNQHVGELLTTDSPVAAAKAAADAYVERLRAVGQKVEDERKLHEKRVFLGQTLGFDMPDQAAARWRLMAGSDDDAINTANKKIGAANTADSLLLRVDANNKRIEELKGDERQARQELTQWQERVDKLRIDGKTADLRIAEATRDKLQADVTSKRHEINGLERDRIATAERLAAQAKDPETKFRLTHPEKPREITNFDDEDHRASAAVTSKAADDQIARNDRAAEEAKRAQHTREQFDNDMLSERMRVDDLLAQMDDDRTQREAKASGDREVTAEAQAKRTLDQRMAEIAKLIDAEEMKIRAMHLKAVEETAMLKDAEDQRTQLLIAAVRDRNAIIEDLVQQSLDRIAAKTAKALADINQIIAQNLRDVEAQMKAMQREYERVGGIIEGVARRSVEDLIRGQESLGQRLVKASLEPVVAILEGYAKQQFVIAGRDAIIGDYLGAAEHTAAGALLLAGASEIGSIAGSGGGGGGGGGGSASGGGGGGMSSASHLGASGGANTQPLQVHVIVVHQDANGREISRVRQEIQRLDDRNVPVRVGGLG